MTNDLQKRYQKWLNKQPKYDKEVQAGYRYAMDSHLPKKGGDWSMFHTFRWLALDMIGMSPTKKKKK
tara:strand:+ start:1427 stop:1627 length:201 start_codon:yes stop_codon:yes gene_type:complete